MICSGSKIEIKPPPSLALRGLSRFFNSLRRAQGAQVKRSHRRVAQRGLTLIEMSIVLVISGLMLEMVVKGRGYSTNTTLRHNIKTGNSVPAAVLAEVDRKIDDGRPGSGRFRFSTYAGAGAAPPVGGTPNGCTDANSSAASWNALSGSDNCGAATLLY